MICSVSIDLFNITYVFIRSVILLIIMINGMEKVKDRLNKNGEFLHPDPRFALKRGKYRIQFYAIFSIPLGI